MGVEPLLDLPPILRADQPVNHLDALIRQVRSCDRFLQDVPQVALRAFPVLGEDQHPTVVPGGRLTLRQLAEGRQPGAEVCPDPIDQPPHLGVGQVPRLLGDCLHPVQKFLLPAPQFFGPFVPRSPFLGRDRHRLDLSFFFGFQLILFPLAPLVIGVRRCPQQAVLLFGFGDIGCGFLLTFPLFHHGAAMHLEGAGEGFDGGEQPLLQPDDEQPGRRLRPPRGRRVPLFPGGAVPIEQLRQEDLGGVGRQVVDLQPLDIPPGESPLDLPDVLLEAAHHHLFELALSADLHPAREPVRVEHFQQGGEAVRVAVVGRGGEEQPVFEATAQVPDGTGELGLDSVAAAAGWGGVVGFVEDQQTSGQQPTQPFPHRVGVGGIDQEVVRDQETAVRPPRVNPEPPLAANPCQVAPVQNLEHQSEALLQLPPPLLQHRGGSRYHDGLGLPSQQQLPGDQASLDRLSEPGVVGDEQVHPGKPQRLAQGLHLVGVDLDAGAEWGLEQVRVGRGDAVPP